MSEKVWSPLPSAESGSGGHGGPFPGIPVGGGGIGRAAGIPVGGVPSLGLEPQRPGGPPGRLGGLAQRLTVHGPSGRTRPMPRGGHHPGIAVSSTRDGTGTGPPPPTVPAWPPTQHIPQTLPAIFGGHNATNSVAPHPAAGHGGLAGHHRDGRHRGGAEPASALDPGWGTGHPRTTVHAAFTGRRHSCRPGYTAP
jgi:hypothetical protein